MSREAAEMPFLDHLEELRGRILRSLAALIVGLGIGIWAVQEFLLVEFLKAPIAPYLPDGRLVILSPTDPIMILLKLGALVGLVLASPVILWQLWAFLSPALYAKEKKAIVPALFAGMVLFFVGSWLGFAIVVPKALSVLLNVQAGVFETMITYDRYFGFVMRLVLAFGLAFELPLLMILLAVLGVVTPAMLSRFRRHAIVLACVGGALVSPGPDVFSMMLMTVPLVFLYEVGLAGVVIVHRRQVRRAAASAALAILLLLAAGVPDAAAQEPPPRQRVSPTATLDSLRHAATALRDTAVARRLGLPTGPSRQFSPADSVIRDLMDRLGFTLTRFRADSAAVRAGDGQVALRGSALTERDGVTLEAEEIRYREDSCELRAVGQPKLFGQGSPVVGDTVRFDTCVERGVVQAALTTLEEQGANWFVRGNLAIDSAATRAFAADGEFTSCDLPVPHYHFAIHQVKWVSRSMLVARPAVLYVRDVPILWLPFLFQDTRPGRRSGLLPPQFGINDIVRPNSGYNRQISGAGYYFAPNEYLGVALRTDWYANRYFEWTAEAEYRWLERFTSGRLQYSRRREPEGASGFQVRWDHQQNFNLTTSLTANVNYMSNTSIVNRNAIDPFVSTQQVSSSINLQRRMAWGSIALGGSRRQNISDGVGSQTLPSLTISPKPVDIGTAITWSPGLSATTSTRFGPSPRPTIVVRPDGGVDTLRAELSARESSVGLDTPLRIGNFNWRNAIRIADRENAERSVTTYRIPDPNSTNPADSITVTRIANGGFSSDLSWDTGINLPLLFRSTWKLQPSVNIVNVLPGQAFAVRNERTGGDWVFQGKRAELRLTAAPTFFGFYGGIGPLSRIRHSISPNLSFAYSPPATVSEKFADAVRTPGRPLDRESPVSRRASISLTQNFEGKARRAAGDTITDERNLPKYRLLSINTSGVDYDFEQAKEEGRTGWVTSTVTNSVQSDLVPGLQLSLAHDLWKGPVGFKGTEFAPFLSSVSASFSLTANTFRGIGALFGLVSPPAEGGPRAGVPVREPAFQPGFGAQASMGGARGMQQFGLGAGGGFSSNISVSVSRARPLDDPSAPRTPTQSSITFASRLQPTTYWGLSWETSYNATDKRFEYHRLRLERDLHEWRAGFNFIRNANGNFSLFFSIYLTDLPDLKADYNQSTIIR